MDGCVFFILIRISFYQILQLQRKISTQQALLKKIIYKNLSWLTLRFK